MHRSTDHSATQTREQSQSPTGRIRGRFTSALTGKPGQAHHLLIDGVTVESAVISAKSDTDRNTVWMPLWGTRFKGFAPGFYMG